MAVAIDNRAKVAVTAFVLFCVSLVLTSWSARNSAVARVGSTVAGEVLYPFRSVSAAVFGRLADAWSGYVALTGVQDENRRLHERLAVLEADNARLLELRGEHERLRAILNMSEGRNLRGVGARVIGRSATSWTQTIDLDQGSGVGIAAGQAVIAGAGLVGQVIAAGPHTAQVLLITDHSSGVDALIQNTRARGIVEGVGEFLCRWRFVLVEDQVKIGDQVVTSGLDGVYPKGLVVGVVTDLERSEAGLFRNIALTPAVDLARLENVFVVTGAAPPGGA